MRCDFIAFFDGLYHASLQDMEWDDDGNIEMKLYANDTNISNKKEYVKKCFGSSDKLNNYSSNKLDNIINHCNEEIEKIMNDKDPWHSQGEREVMMDVYRNIALKVEKMK